MEHWLVELEDGTRAFAKVAVDEPTAGFLRDEHRVYSQVEARFLPAFLGWDDDGERPILAARRPERRRTGRRRGAKATCGRRSRRSTSCTRRTAAEGCPRLTLDELHTWREVEASPEPFLSLGLCSADWLERALPELLAASERCVITGDAFVHLDTRSDNVCIVDGRARSSSTGTGPRTRRTRWSTLAFWMPSLFAEGGPAPTEALPDAGELTAVVSGFFAPIAGLPPPAGAPTVRAAPARAAEGRAAVGRGGPRAAAPRPLGSTAWTVTSPFSAEGPAATRPRSAPRSSARRPSASRRSPSSAGTCLRVGCIPTKAWVQTAFAIKEAEETFGEARRPGRRAASSTSRPRTSGRTASSSR